MSNMTAGIALALVLVATPAGSFAPVAGEAGTATLSISGISLGPANVGGLNKVYADPSGIGNAARMPALPSAHRRSPDSPIPIRSWSDVMRKLQILCAAVSIGLSGTAFARGGMGSSHMSTMGGAFGTSPAAPGTNSLGTALSSSGIGRTQKGPPLGTRPAIDREEEKSRQDDRFDLPRLLT